MGQTPKTPTDLADVLLEYETDPYGFVHDILRVTPYPWQRECLEAYGSKPDIKMAIKSRPEVGKSTFASWVILHRLIFFPWCKIPCTATTDHQLRNILWAELAKWIRTSCLSMILTHEANKIYPSFPADAKKEWFAVPVVAAKSAGEDTKVGLQGFHGAGLMFVVDEAGGIDNSAWAAIHNAFTNTNTSQAALLAIGNPTTETDTQFCEMFDSMSKHYWTLHVGKQHEPKPSQQYQDFIAGLYGKDSAMWEIKIEGNFPTGGSVKTLISLQDLEGCLAPIELDDCESPIILGIDPARYGDDTTGWALVRHGGRKTVLAIWETKKESTMETVGRAVTVARELSQKKNGHLKEIRVDEIGIGSGVVDRLQEMKSDPECKEYFTQTAIVGVNVARKPTQATYLTGSAPGTLRDELWLAMAECVKIEHPDFSAVKDSVVMNELRWPTYTIRSDGRMIIESKDALKKRGKRSPNCADALNMAMFSNFNTEWDVWGGAGESGRDVGAQTDHRNVHDVSELVKVDGMYWPSG